LQPGGSHVSDLLLYAVFWKTQNTHSHDRFSVSGNLVLDSHGRFNAYLCHVLNINLRITCDRFEGCLSLDFCSVWGGEAFSHLTSVFSCAFFPNLL
jgi:hypothetical protein